jgi:glycosyltransferase involved in cell wall biosynthesis
MNKRHDIQVVSFWDKPRTDWLLGTTLKASSSSKDYVIDGIPVHHIGLGNREKFQIAPYVILYYAWMRLAIERIAESISPHLEPYARGANLVHNVRIGREPISFASLNVARKNDIPFILTPVHHPRWKDWRYRAYDWLYRQADGVITLTEAEKNILVKEIGVREERIYVTGMGPVLASRPEPEAFCLDRKISGPFVLFLGQHFQYKGFSKVLEAAPLVWGKIPEVNFVFIGPAVGNSEQYFQQNSDPRIHRLGQVSLQEKTNALAACALLCVPSTQESFGGVYTEAWSFEKPVIGCPIPAVSEVIADGIDGYLVKQNSTEIADRIIDLISNPSRAKGMGEAGSQKVMRRFTWEKLAELTEQAYKQVKEGE